MVREVVEKFEIVSIFNKYKKTFNNLINSLDAKFLKAPRSESAPISARLYLEKNLLKKDRKGQKGEKNY